MTTYIALIDFTEQGIRDIKESPGRAADFDSMAEAAGATIKGQYWTAGSHDGVLIFDAADDESASVLLLRLAAGGNVRTELMRAFDKDEMAALVTRLP